MIFFHGKLFAIVAILCNVAKGDSNVESKVIETNVGKIRGLRQTTLIKEVDFYSFKGIPYAESPIGRLRFKAPEPAGSWAPTELEAYQHGNTCVRPNQFAPDALVQSEDCLFLNIYVPADVQSDEKLPVLAYIHGGAFSEGSANDNTYGPDFIIEQRAILVTFNYRLGVFGFLSLNSTEYSGNMALKDQQLALKWIHSNIEHFSGDNQRIMLFGESAGGALAHFHILSSESRKYFRNAALLSGTAENFWAFSEENDHSPLAYKMASDLGNPKQTFEELVEFLQTVEADKIVGYGSVKNILRRTARGTFAPVIERKDAVRPFIVDWPETIYNESNIDVDVMFGLCTAEALTFYLKFFDEIYNFYDLNYNFTLRLPFREVDLPYRSPEHIYLSHEIREFYFKDAVIDRSVLKQYIDLLSDMNFDYGIHKAARQHAAKTNSKAFFHRFAVDSRLNMLKRFNVDVSGLPGAGHGNDLCYIFRCKSSDAIYNDILKNKDSEQSKISLQTIENMTRLLTNFAKYGEPTHDNSPISGFLPIQGDRMNFLDVSNDGLRADINPNQDAMQLWAHIEQEVDEFKQH